MLYVDGIGIGWEGWLSYVIGLLRSSTFGVKKKRKNLPRFEAAAAGSSCPAAAANEFLLLPIDSVSWTTKIIFELF